jgi:hypothetical protein
MSESSELGSTYVPELVELDPQDTAVVSGHVTSAEIPRFLEHAFRTTATDAARSGRIAVGPPFGRFVPTRIGFEVEAGFPIDAPLTPVGEAVPGHLPPGPAVSVVHVGDDGSVGAAYAAARQWADDHGYVVAGEPWESYPDTPDVARPRSVVYLPCRTET